MTGSERVERQLQGILEDLAAPRRPDYLDDLHRQLAATLAPARKVAPRD
jgi:hypothetical protein